MNIDAAIRILTEAKVRGVTSVILSHWTGVDCGFDEKDVEWEYIADDVMAADWGLINTRVAEMVEAAYDDILAEAEDAEEGDKWKNGEKDAE